jgi:hypothetical protein
MNWDRTRQIARWLVLLWAAVGFWLSMSGYRHLAWVFVLLIPLTIMFASLGGFHTQKELDRSRKLTSVVAVALGFLAVVILLRRGDDHLVVLMAMLAVILSTFSLVLRRSRAQDTNHTP